VKARNLCLIYGVGNVVILWDGKVMQENVNRATTSSGCHRCFGSCLALCFKQKGTNATEVSLLH